MTEWIEQKLNINNSHEAAAANSPATTLSSSVVSENEECDFTNTTSSSTSSSSLQNVHVQSPGLWKYSKTRQFTFWVKKSLRDVISPDLNVVYEERQLESSSHADSLPHLTQYSESTEKKLLINEGESSHDIIHFGNCIKNDKVHNEEDYYEYDNEGRLVKCNNLLSENLYHNHLKCENIDDAMNGLHMILPHDIAHYNHHFHHRRNTSSSAVSTVSSSTSCYHEYDWILDGDIIDYEGEEADISDDDDENDNSDNVVYESEGEDTNSSIRPHTNNRGNKKRRKKQKRERIGVEGLDDALENMELECTPCNTPSRSSSTEITYYYDNNSDDKNGIHSDNNHCAENDTVRNDDEINMNKHLVLIDSEKLMLTPKIHNHTSTSSVLQEKHTSKEIGYFDHVLDHLPSFDEKNGGHRQFLTMLKHPDPSVDRNDVETMIMETPPKRLNQCFMDDYHHDCILDHLPFEDPSTPEGKFFRNLQMEREQSSQKKDNINAGSAEVNNGTNEDLTSDLLPSEFYCPDFDPVINMLKSIPWEDQWSEEEEQEVDPVEKDDNEGLDYLPIIQIDNCLTEKLSHFDEISQEIKKQLLDSINQNEDDIKEKMYLIQALDCDVTNALSYAKQANLYLQRARGRDKFNSLNNGRNGITGGLQIIEEANQRDKLRNLNGILKSCEELFEIEQSIRLMCEKLDTKMLLSRSDYLVTLIEMCKTLKDAVIHDKRFVGLNALQDLRERVLHLMDSLRIRLENQLVCFISQRCISIHLSPVEKLNDDLSREFRVLLNARLYLHDHLGAEEYLHSDNQSESAIPIYTNSWSESIIKALCFEAERSLARSLLDPTTFEEEIIYASNGAFDENLMEMRTKLNRIQSFDEDAASIRSTIKNLLSVRFQFEKSYDLLPWIYHKLCCFISEVLHTHYQLCQWHDSAKENCTKNQVHKIIFDEMCDMKKHLWMHCKSLIVFLLESFLEFKKGGDNDNFLWAQELECNNDILQLSLQIIRLANDFTNDDEVETFLSSTNCSLKSILSLLFERFVRCAHVSAMTEIGTMMASDTWELVSIPIVSSKDERMPLKEKIHDSVQNYFVNMYKGETSSSQSVGKVRSWHTLLESKREEKFTFSCFAQNGNPFRLVQSVTENKDDVLSQISTLNLDEQTPKSLLYSKLAHIISDDDIQLTIGTQTALNGIGRWTIRLLTIRKTLPLVNDQVGNIIRNIYDLYFLTVFRLCVGNATMEDIVIGNIKRSDTTFNDSFPDCLSPSAAQMKATKSKQQKSQSFGRRRQTSNENIPQNTCIKNSVTKYCNADIHSPLPEDEQHLSHVRLFLRRAQASLTGKVDLDQIENWKLGSVPIDHASSSVNGLYLQKRVAASFSCLFVASLFDIAFHTMLPCLNSEHDQLRDHASLSIYLKQMLNAVLHIHVICLRLSTIRALDGRGIVMKVVSVGDGWAESKLNEHCNDYVEPLVERCTSLLKYLSSCQLKNQPSIIKETWDYIAESGFLALLEGFGKIYDCSTEGRALMSMDLATFSTTIPPASPKRGMQYVDMYIKVFYFPEEDVMNWIRENKEKYNIHHLMTLVSFGAHNKLPQASKNKISELRETIREM